MAYNTCTDKKVFNSKEYHAWSYMLRMVYEDNERFNRKRKNRTITICEEWLDFANFNEWFGENYYTVGNETMDLCRNLLNQDNDEFSPDECVFIPRRIMQLITPKNLSKSGLPRGVGYRECSDKYYSTCYKQVDGKATTVRHSGFKTAEEAFLQYKKDKEDYIKEVAREHQIEIVENKPLARMLYANVEIGAEIPPELYQAVAEVLAFVYHLKGKI